MKAEVLETRIGREIGVSDWIVLDQGRIDAFADVTDDHQFIHVDRVRAAKTPFGGTLAHGFLTLSMLSAMSYQAVPDLEGQTHGLNYGFDRIRFVSPVPAGARLRGRFTLAALRWLTPDELELSLDVIVEAEAQGRPALAARWLQRRYFA